MSASYDPKEILEAQRRFFASSATKPVSFRKEYLSRLAAVIFRRSDDLITALGDDLGKPGVEAYVSEVYFVLSEIRFFLKNLDRWARPRRVGSPFYFSLPEANSGSNPLAHRSLSRPGIIPCNSP